MHKVTDCTTVAEFCDRYYKHERYYGRGKEYADVCLKYHQKNYDELGYTMLSRHESRTGEAVTFYKLSLENGTANA